MNKLKVAILGTGNIGTDLLLKVIKSNLLTCTLFAGRNLDSPGMKLAKSLDVNVTPNGCSAIVQDPSICDIVVDCTSAQDHIKHWEMLKPLNKIVIDMTPAKIGNMCIPAINIANDFDNINLITCGGQSAIPIAYAISQAQPDIDYIEIASSIASLSAGPATRANLDEYVETTEYALKKFTGVKNTKAILILNPANPPIDMQTTIYARIKNPDIPNITQSVMKMVNKLKQYVPGYSLIVPPTLVGNNVVTTIKVLGAGDYLPPYAGNLDIINCASISIMETISTSRKEQ